MINEFGGVIFTGEHANRPPEEWERDRPVQIPFGMFGVDRMMATMNDFYAAQQAQTAAQWERQVEEVAIGLRTISNAARRR